jgi:predicted transcriptional regulator
MRFSEVTDSLLKRKGGEIWSVHSDQSVYEAIEKMAAKGVGALLVISEGELVGAISPSATMLAKSSFRKDLRKKPK